MAVDKPIFPNELAGQTIQGVKVEAPMDRESVTLIKQFDMESVPDFYERAEKKGIYRECHKCNHVRRYSIVQCPKCARYIFSDVQGKPIDPKTGKELKENEIEPGLCPTEQAMSEQQTKEQADADEATLRKQIAEMEEAKKPSVSLKPNEPRTTNPDSPVSSSGLSDPDAVTLTETTPISEGTSNGEESQQDTQSDSESTEATGEQPTAEGQPAKGKRRR